MVRTLLNGQQLRRCNRQYQLHALAIAIDVRSLSRCTNNTFHGAVLPVQGSVHIVFRTLGLFELLSAVVSTTLGISTNSKASLTASHRSTIWARGCPFVQGPQGEGVGSLPSNSHGTRCRTSSRSLLARRALHVLACIELFTVPHHGRTGEGQARDCPQCPMVGCSGHKGCSNKEGKEKLGPSCVVLGMVSFPIAVRFPLPRLYFAALLSAATARLPPRDSDAGLPCGCSV